ncbi:MAG: acyl-CoA dehydrogenase family protein [Dehalococcoidia bacterium]
MQFDDSETQKLLRDTARSYLADRFPLERLYALEQGERLSEAELRGFAELGWPGLLAPDPAGGGGPDGPVSGASLLEAAAVIEEFGYAGVPAPVTVCNVVAALLPDGEHLRALATGERLYTVAEACRRSANGVTGDPLSASGGTLSGTLPLVPFAGVAEYVLAPLRLDGAPAFALLSLADVHLEPVDTLDRRPYHHVHFEGAALDDALVLARGDEAEALGERCDALVTALSLVELAGMMRRVLEMTGEYISNRVQFGQPIAKFQAARHRAAELLMQTESTRWAAYHALWRLQQDPDAAAEVWLAKHWAIRAAGRVFEVSHLLHGGVGVGMEYPLHLYTQAIASFAVRGGTMDEMTSRTLESLRAGAAAR